MKTTQPWRSKDVDEWTLGDHIHSLEQQTVDYLLKLQGSLLTADKTTWNKDRLEAVNIVLRRKVESTRR